MPDRRVFLDREFDIEDLLVAAVVEVADASLDDKPVWKRAPAGAGDKAGRGQQCLGRGAAGQCWAHDQTVTRGWVRRHLWSQSSPPRYAVS